MKSKVLEVFPMDKVDIRQFQKRFELDEGKIEQEIAFLRNKNGRWEDWETVEKDCVMVCSMTSGQEFFNREHLELLVGQGFFHQQFEEACIGLKKGQSKVTLAGGWTVEVTVEEIRKRIVPDDIDRFVKELGIEKVENEASYREYLARQQKTERFHEESWEPIHYVMGQIFKNSHFELVKEDWETMIELTLERLEAISNTKNLSLKTMTPEDFEGKIPVKSYYELVATVQSEAWENLQQYLLGRYYGDRDGFAPTKEEYDVFVEEYARDWHDTPEDAAKINTFEGYQVNEYKLYFYNKVKEYVEENYFVEE